MKIAIFLADGFEEIEAVAIIDILRRGGQSVDLISVAGVLDVKGSHDILVHCNLNFYDISEILLMAIESPNKSIKESSMEVT